MLFVICLISLFKILILIPFLIIAKIYKLIEEGIIQHKYAYGILKILKLNTIFLSLLAVKFFYLGILIIIKEVIPPILKTAAKAFITPIK